MIRVCSCTGQQTARRGVAGGNRGKVVEVAVLALYPIAARILRQRVAVALRDGGNNILF